MNLMTRLRILGILLAAAGLAAAGGGFLYGMPQADDGLDSAQAMYEAQGVKLSYDKNGTLVDRGTPEGARRIMALLVDDWKYPVNRANLDPNNPVVNTRDELMFFYATITYHVLNQTVAVKLTEKDVAKPLEFRGVTYDKAGTYNLTVQKYYAQFDRSNPIERQLRDAWSPQALALTGSLSGGHANQAAGELAKMTTLAVGAIGLLFTFAGVGLVWVSFGRPETAEDRRAAGLATTLVAPGK